MRLGYKYLDSRAQRQCQGREVTVCSPSDPTTDAAAPPSAPWAPPPSETEHCPRESQREAPCTKRLPWAGQPFLRTQGPELGPQRTNPTREATKLVLDPKALEAETPGGIPRELSHGTDDSATQVMGAENQRGRRPSSLTRGTRGRPAKVCLARRRTGPPARAPIGPPTRRGHRAGAL